MDNLFMNLCDRRGNSKDTHKRTLIDVKQNCKTFFENRNKKARNGFQLEMNVEQVEDEYFDDQLSFLNQSLENSYHYPESDIESDSSTVYSSDHEPEVDENFEYVTTDSEEEFTNSELNILKIEESTIGKDLLHWCLECNIRNQSLSKLLVILRKHGLKVPKDARTLKGLNVPIQTRDVFPGKYWHFGVEKMVSKLIDSDIDLPDVLTLDNNIDGLTVYKSSKEVFWPILGKFQEIPKMKPFTIGIYHHSSKKPKDVNCFLQDFITEMKRLTLPGAQKLVRPGYSIMDAPAMAAMKMVKQHNGANACPYCNVVGQHEGRMCFPSFIGEPRSDESFRDREDPFHHTTQPGETGPFEELDVDMIANFPPDYLHAVCLGIVKKKLSLLTGQKNIKFFKTPVQQEMFRKTDFINIAKATALSRMSQPKDVHRAIRQLDDLNHFKGTELRAFILYYGIVVLKDNADPLIYKNYVYLQCAITICLCDNYRHYLPLAEELIKNFVEDYKIIYGPSMISYNVHQLLHLCEVVRRSGSLEHYSAFPYESKLQVMKNSISSGNNPLQQIANRTVERNRLDIHNLKKCLNEGKLILLL